MTLDTSAMIGLVSLVATLLIAAAYGAGVNVGKHKERILKFAQEFEKFEQNKIGRRFVQLSGKRLSATPSVCIE